jgi:hypothetical protein
MSYRIILADPITDDAIDLEAPMHMRQGLCPFGGSMRAELSVTSNYARYFESMGTEGIREINGKTGAESFTLLMPAIERLGFDKTDNYWQATEGNARIALMHLCYLAMMFPNGIWHFH